MNYERMVETVTTTVLVPATYVANADKDKDRVLIQEVTKALAEALIEYDCVCLEQEFDIERQGYVLTFSVEVLLPLKEEK